MKKFMLFLFITAVTAQAYAQPLIEVQNQSNKPIWVAVTQAQMVNNAVTRTRHRPVKMPAYKAGVSLPFQFNPRAGTDQFTIDIWKAAPEVMDDERYWVNNDTWLTKPTERYSFTIDRSAPKTFHGIWTGNESTPFQAQGGTHNVTQHEIDVARK